MIEPGTRSLVGIAANSEPFLINVMARYIDGLRAKNVQFGMADTTAITTAVRARRQFRIFGLFLLHIIANVGLIIETQSLFLQLSIVVNFVNSDSLGVEFTNFEKDFFESRKIVSSQQKVWVLFDENASESHESHNVGRSGLLYVMGGYDHSQFFFSAQSDQVVPNALPQQGIDADSRFCWVFPLE